MTAYNDDVAETVSPSDAFASLAALLDAQAETITVTDDPLVSVVGYGAAVADTVSPLDVFTGGAAFVGAAVESISPSDQLSAGFVYSAAVTEVGTTSDLVAREPEPGQYDYYFQFENAEDAAGDPIVGPYVGSVESPNVGMVDTRINEYLYGFWLSLSFPLPLKDDLLASPNLRLVVNATQQAAGQASVWVTDMDQELLLHTQVVALYAGGAVYGYSRIVDGQA